MQKLFEDLTLLITIGRKVGLPEFCRLPRRISERICGHVGNDPFPADFVDRENIEDDVRIQRYCSEDPGNPCVCTRR